MDRFHTDQPTSRTWPILLALAVLAVATVIILNHYLPPSGTYGDF